MRPLSFAPLLAILLLGCVASEVRRPPLDPELERLASLNSHPVQIRVVSAEPGSVVGRQFALIVLPLGTVSIGDPRLDLEQELFRTLTLRGYRPERVAGSAGGPAIELVLERVSLHAYDLLFVRRLVADVSITGRASGRRGEFSQSEVTGSAAEFRRFGWSPDLSKVYGDALADGVRQLLDGLNFPELG